MDTQHPSEDREANFLRRWALANLFGSLLGWLYVFIGIVVLIETRLLGDYMSFITIGLVFGLPFGVILGATQWSSLRQCPIQPSMWILATSLGCGITFSTVAFLWEKHELSFWGFFALLSATLLIDGAIASSLQFVVLRKILTNPKMWLVANALGQLLVGVLIVIVYVLTEATDNLLFGLLGITILGLGVVRVAIQTGKVLWKHISWTSIQETPGKNELSSPT